MYNKEKRLKSPEEKMRKKILVEEQRKGRKDQEINKKKTKEIQELQLKERLNSVKELQKRIREEDFLINKKPIKTGRKKHKKKIKKHAATVDPEEVHINRWIRKTENEDKIEIEKKQKEGEKVIVLKKKSKSKRKATTEDNKKKVPETERINIEEENKKAPKHTKSKQKKQKRVNETDTETKKLDGHEQKQNYKKLQREVVARKAEQIREQQAQRLINPLSNSNLHGQSPVVLLSYVPKANPRGLSTSSYAAPPPVVNPPLASHAGDVTAPVGVHMGEEEKQKLRESWRERMHEFQVKLHKHDTKKKPEENKATSELPLQEEEKKQILPSEQISTSKPGIGDKSPSKKMEDITPSKTFDSQREGLTPKENDPNHNKDVLSKELERIDEQFEIHGENSSERKDADDFNKDTLERKQSVKSSAQKEAEDYGQILQSMEEMEKDPIQSANIAPATKEKEVKLEIKKSPVEHKKDTETEENKTRNPEEQNMAGQAIKDFDSENEKEVEPQAIICTAREDLRDHMEEKRLKALEEETKQINEQLKKELAKKDEMIMAQALRETKLQKECQELIANQTKEIMQKVIEVTHSIQSEHNDQMSKVMNKLCDHLEKLTQKANQAEEQAKQNELEAKTLPKSLQPSPEPKQPQEAKTLEHKKRKPADTLVSKTLEKQEEIQEEEKDQNEDEKNEKTEKVEIEHVKKEELNDSDVGSNSFSHFTYSKLKEILKSDEENDILRKKEESLRKQHEEKVKELGELYRKGHIAPQEHASQKEELDRWLASQQKELLSTKKKKMVRALKQTAEIIDQIDKEEEKEKSIEKNENVEQEKPKDIEERQMEDMIENDNDNKGIDEDNTQKENQNEQPIQEITKNELSHRDSEIKSLPSEYLISAEMAKVEDKGTTKTEDAKADKPIGLEEKQEKVQGYEEVKVVVNEVKENFSIMPDISPAHVASDTVEVQKTDQQNAIKIKSMKDLNHDEKADVITEMICEDIMTTLKDNLFPKRFSDPRIGQIEGGPRPPSGIKTAIWNVECYISEVFKEITEDPDKFVLTLSIPLNRDPLFILGQIQNEDSDYFETIEQIMTQPVLPVELYLSIEHSKKVDSIDDTPEDARHEALLTEWSNIHNKCIFDAINDALDFYRPYGLKGPPLPWSKQVRELTYRNGSVASIQDVLLGAKAKVLAWASNNSGALRLCDEFDFASIMGQIGMLRQGGEKTKLDQFREERLEAMLATEVNEIEPTWIDYELEETQVILDVADMILEQLTSECMSILIETDQKKKNA